MTEGEGIVEQLRYGKDVESWWKLGAEAAAEIERLQAEVERLRPRTADDLICIIRDWLGSDDATHWGQFEQQLDAAITATDEKEQTRG